MMTDTATEIDLDSVIDRLLEGEQPVLFDVSRGGGCRSGDEGRWTVEGQPFLWREIGDG